MSHPIDITKNKREVIRIERQTFKGHDIINMRVFYFDPAGDGEMKPGKQGVAFRAVLLPQILDALSGVKEQEDAA